MKERIWGWMPGPFQAQGLIRGLQFPAHEIMMRLKNWLSNVTVTSRKCQGGARNNIPMFFWPGAVQGPEHPWISLSAMGMLCSPFPLFEGDGIPEQRQDLASTSSGELISMESSSTARPLLEKFLWANPNPSPCSVQIPLQIPALPPQPLG